MTAPIPTALLGSPVRFANPDEGASWFVWGIWALLAVGSLVFIRAYGCNVPFFDEWEMVPAVTGNHPIDFTFFWCQHNEHRLPLPRLLYLGLAKLTHSDFRAGMYFNGIVLSGLALAMILAARRLRGWTTYADAFFPLALIVGHHENLLWSFQVELVLSTLLACTLLLLVVHGREPPTGRAVLLGGVCLLLLPLTGAHGLPFVPPLALWLVLWAFHHRHRAGLWTLALAMVCAVAAVALVVFYFHDFHRPGNVARAPSVWDGLLVSLEFLTVGAGSAVAALWPYSGYAVASLLLVGAAALFWIWLKRADERVRCVGLLLFLVAVIGLALGVGIGRAGVGAHAGFTPRYTTLAAPALCGLYFIGILSRGPLGRLLPMGLFTALAVLLMPNLEAGLAFARYHHAKLAGVEHELSGKYQAPIVAQHHPCLYPSQELLAVWIDMLRRAAIGNFKYLSAPPALHEEELTVAPAVSERVAWQKGVARIGGAASFLEYRLPRLRVVQGIRLRYAYAEKADVRAQFGMSWQTSQETESEQEPRGTRFALEASPGERTVTVYVNDTIDRFRIRPDTGPCTFKILGLQLLVPESGAMEDLNFAARRP